MFATKDEAIRMGLTTPARVALGLTLPDLDGDAYVEDLNESYLETLDQLSGEEPDGYLNAIKGDR